MIWNGDALMSISLTVVPPLFATQTWVPSDEIPHGWTPTAKGAWTTEPVEASSSVTVLLSVFATQTWVPSEETPSGLQPTPMVWTTAPVEASSSVTMLVVGIRHPDVGAVRGDGIGVAARVDGLDHRAGRGVQLGDRVVDERFRHPDVGAVRRDAIVMLPTAMVWMTAPVEASSSVTVPLSHRSPPRRGCRPTRHQRDRCPRRWSGPPSRSRRPAR